MAGDAQAGSGMSDAHNYGFERSDVPEKVAFRVFLGGIAVNGGISVVGVFLNEGNESAAQNYNQQMGALTHEIDEADSLQRDLTDASLSKPVTIQAQAELSKKIHSLNTQMLQMEANKPDNYFLGNHGGQLVVGGMSIGVIAAFALANRVYMSTKAKLTK